MRKILEDLINGNAFVPEDTLNAMSHELASEIIRLRKKVKRLESKIESLEIKPEWTR